MAATNCEECSNYVFDDGLEAYVCAVDMDEDEYYRFMSSSDYACPYFRREDDYFLAKKQ